MNAIVAEERLTARRAAGEPFVVIASLGQPYRVGPEEWACAVSLAGLHDALTDIHGASSLQALCLAASLLRQLLTSFVEDGGRLFSDGGHEPFDIASCFSRVGAPGP